MTGTRRQAGEKYGQAQRDLGALQSGETFDLLIVGGGATGCGDRGRRRQPRPQGGAGRARRLRRRRQRQKHQAGAWRRPLSRAGHTSSRPGPISSRPRRPARALDFPEECAAPRKAPAARSRRSIAGATFLMSSPAFASTICWPESSASAPAACSAGPRSCAIAQPEGRGSQGRRSLLRRPVRRRAHGRRRWPSRRANSGPPSPPGSRSWA